LSVEYWADEDSPTDGYFDPISLLGAKTPELDLGIHYSRISENGRRVMRYSKVTRFESTSPGGSNTFPPNTDGDKSKADKKSDADEDDEIVDEDANEPEKYEQEDEEVPKGALSEGDIQQLVAAMTPLIDEAVDARIAMMSAPKEGDLGQLSDSDPAADPEEEIDPDAVDDLDDDRDDEDDTDPFTEEDDDMADENTVPVVDEDDDKKKAVKYAKDNADLRVKYEREVKARRNAETELTALKSRVDSIEASGRKATRYQKLSALQNEGYVLDPDEEIAEVESFADDQFTKHCERIVAKYQRVPLGQLPIPASPKYDGTKQGAADKYEKCVAKAKDNCLAAHQQGKQLDYAAELKRLVEESSAA